MPCEKCIKRGDAASCTFAPGRKKASSSSSDSPNSDEMQNRIDRLEGLVLSLVSNGGAVPSNGARALSTSESTDSAEYNYNRSDPDTIPEADEDQDQDEDEESDVEQISKSMGILKVMDKSQTQFYVGDTHWATVLKDIKELKEHYNQQHVQNQYKEQMLKVEAFQNQTGSVGPMLLRGVGAVPSPELLSASMPYRSVVDKLVARFFSGSDCSSDPSLSELSFVGLLYAIMTLAIQSYDRVGDSPDEYRGKEAQIADEYRVRTVQCLLAANYYKPTPRILLILYLYLQGEYVKCRDASFGLWLLVGTVVRIAMRMGYHRDVSDMGSVSAFEGEMRCRLWAAIVRADLLFSFQIGLPNMIQRAHVDRVLPRNLNDEDFGEDTEILPPSRPTHESTQMSYFIAITRLSLLFQTVTDTANAITPCSFEMILRMDADLRAEKTQVPDQLRMKPLSELKDEPPMRTMERLNLDMLHYKALIVLHRRYFSSSRTNDRYIYCRDTCVDSALKLLEYQAILHEETRPVGSLKSARWFLASLNMSDYLLAGTILCLDLYYQAEAVNSNNATYGFNAERSKREIRACIRARHIWKESMENSMEAFKAVTTLDVMTAQVTKTCPEWMRLQLCGNGGDANAPPLNGNGQGDLNAAQQPEQAAAMTLGMLSGGLSPSAAALYDQNYVTTPGRTNIAMADPQASLDTQFATDDFSGFFDNPGSVSDVPMTLDLPVLTMKQEAWDSYLQSTSFDGLGQGFAGMDIPDPFMVNTANIEIPTGTGMPTSTTATGTNPIKMEPVFQQQQQPQLSQQQKQQNYYLNGAGVFMGVQSPPTTGSGI
ncbi:MAG: hypothetical protein M1814_006900 [Vezdaea aestivalis]|nr:MAG: hypothetical protein M1814_006900 [Vezdaea aestivalis]